MFQCQLFWLKSGLRSKAARPAPRPAPALHPTGGSPALPNEAALGEGEEDPGQAGVRALHRQQAAVSQHAPAQHWGAALCSISLDLPELRDPSDDVTQDAGGTRSVPKGCCLFSFRSFWRDSVRGGGWFLSSSQGQLRTAWGGFDPL